MAELVIESKGEFEGAVRVTVDGKELGSIPTGLAGAFREAIKELECKHEPATCRAQLEADAGVSGAVDVFLWAGAAPMTPGDEPFLPPGLGSKLHLFPGQAERLDEGLHSRAKAKRVLRSGVVGSLGDRWCVTLDGESIGTLGPGSYCRLQEASSAGFPLTCRVRIIRAPERPVRILADLPPD